MHQKIQCDAICWLYSAISCLIHHLQIAQSIISTIPIPRTTPRTTGCIIFRNQKTNSKGIARWVDISGGKDAPASDDSKSEEFGLLRQPSRWLFNEYWNYLENKLHSQNHANIRHFHHAQNWVRAPRYLREATPRRVSQDPIRQNEIAWIGPPKRSPKSESRILRENVVLHHMQWAEASQPRDIENQSRRRRRGDRMRTYLGDYCLWLEKL